MQQGWNPQGGAPGAPQGYGQPQGGYGQPPQPQGYGAPPQQAPQQMQPPGGYGAPPQASPQTKMPAFVGGLFDFTFTNFVTTKVIKVLYGLWLLGCAGLVLVGLFASFNTMFFGYRTHIGEGLLMLIATPIAAALYLILGRVYFEIIIVLFRIAENLMELNRKTKDATAPGA